jgi:hypothetical protein
MSSLPLWTSTQFHNWKTDFATCAASHQAFEVRDVNNPEQETFCLDHCELQHYMCVVERCTASCNPVVSHPVPSGLPKT